MKTAGSLGFRGAAMAALWILAAGCNLGVFNKDPVPLGPPPSEPERTPIYEDASYIIARASLHNHTTFSDGCRAPEDLLELAERQGMAILSYTDHREGTFCMGSGSRFCVKAGGVEDVGYDVYYERLREIQGMALDRGMIVTKGVEVSPPWMYNRGKAPGFMLEGQNRHFTVYNVEDPEILANMPVRNQLTFKPEPMSDVWGPLQEFVDYLDERDAIVHAVHVESDQDDWYGPVHLITQAPVYSAMLERVTCFSVLPEAWEYVGRPGGIWDSVLLEYQAGTRDRPLWAAADADYHGPRSSLARATTLFYMKEFTEAEVYNCMREGRMAALSGDAFQDVYVSRWNVSDGGVPADDVMLGRSLTLSRAPRIRFSLNKPVDGCVTLLVRNGVVISETPGVEIDYVDEERGSSREPAYYRVEVRGPAAGREYYEGDTIPESELFVNPIFVKFGPRP